MAPELLNFIDAQELRDLANEAIEYQQAKGLSRNGLLKKFPSLGSDKTLSRILNNDLAQVDLEKQLTNYRAAVTQMKAMGDEEDEEEIFDDLTASLELRRIFLETSTQSGIARFILLEGDTGMGKTFAIRALVKKFGMRLRLIEASEAWNDKPNALLASILTVLGEKELPTNQYERLELAVKRLNQSRVGVAIDEAHHLGPACLNVIKTLINRTKCEFIAGAMRTLWNRLERDSYQEVKQLTGNRLAERIRLQLRETDVEMLLTRRLEIKGADLKKAVGIVMHHASTRDNLAFVRNVCRHARERADGEDVTVEIITAAVSTAVNRRGT